MGRFRTILRLLALLALANLVLMPLVAPAKAMMRTAAASVAAGGDAMPCCPPDEPMPADCGGCIATTICVAKPMPAISVLQDVRPAQYRRSTIILSASDMLIAGIGLRPPKPPPRA